MTSLTARELNHLIEQRIKLMHVEAGEWVFDQKAPEIEILSEPCESCSA